MRRCEDPTTSHLSGRGEVESYPQAADQPGKKLGVGPNRLGKLGINFVHVLQNAENAVNAFRLVRVRLIEGAEDLNKRLEKVALQLHVTQGRVAGANEGPRASPPLKPDGMRPPLTRVLHSSLAPSRLGSTASPSVSS